MKPIPGCSEVEKHIQNLMLSITAEVASLVWVMALSCWRSIGIFPQSTQLIHCFNFLLPCTPGEWHLCISRKWWAYTFQWKDQSWNLCFYERCGDNNQVTGFSLWCAQIPSPVPMAPTAHIFRNPNLEQSHCHKLNQCLTFQLWPSWVICQFSWVSSSTLGLF